MAIDVEALLERAPAEDAAAFVGFLMLQAGEDAELNPALEPHVARFIELAGLAAPDLDDDARQQAVDAFFEAHPVSEALQAAFDAHLAAVSAGVSRGEAQTERAAAELLGASKDLMPVGQARVPGTMRGGAAGILAARTTPKK
jgi:hypothetical protein